MRAKRSTRLIAGAALLVIAIVCFGYMSVNSWIHQSRVDAARQLVSSPPSTVDAVASTPSAMTVTPSPSTRVVAPATASSPTPAAEAIVYPIQGFSWPDAGIKVATVTMDQATWQQQAVNSGINPPLDANGFDRVGHWLDGTGPTLGHPTHSVVIAAHTCYSLDALLCNDATFPFRRLSYDGWAVGQHAAIVDAAGHSFDLTLASRQLVPKSGFMLDDDSCEVQVFSCTEGDTHNTATLITFRRTQCAA